MSPSTKIGLIIYGLSTKVALLEIWSYDYRPQYTATVDIPDLISGDFSRDSPQRGSKQHTLATHRREEGEERERRDLCLHSACLQY